MKNDYYIGIAKKQDYNELMKLLNDTFDFPEDGRGFLAFLPKLYKKEYSPWKNNVIVRKEGKILAATGVYYAPVHVGEHTLLSAGIGNVAVDKKHRGAGYMRDTMRYALADMKKNRVDFSFLGGRRQRYMYFSYETAGPVYSFTINETSLQHSLGKDFTSRLTSKKISQESTQALDAAHRLYTAQKVHFERKRDGFYDTLTSWHGIPYAVYTDETFAGYYIVNKSLNHIYEICAADSAMLPAIAAEAVKIMSVNSENERSYSLTLPAYESEYLKQLLPLCEGLHSFHCEHFSILNYRNVIEAFLKLKSSYARLSDGCLTMLVHGEAGDECLEISAKNNKIHVCAAQKPIDIELSHLEAIRLLCGLYSERRQEIPPECAQWFPLPLSISSVDGV